MEKQEKRAAARYEKAKPSVFATVQDKIPDGLRGKLELAFCKEIGRASCRERV